MAGFLNRLTQPLRLRRTLAQEQGQMVLLPSGLYNLDNVLIPDTQELAGELLRTFPTGATLAIQERPGLTSYHSDHFTEVRGPAQTGWSTVGDLLLSIEFVRQEISRFHFDPARHPYHNYLEAVLMQLFIDGLALGKKLAGGVWLSDSEGSNSADVRQLEIMIQMKNDTIYTVSDILKTYPAVFTMNFAKFELPAYRAWLPGEQSALEYRILQIRHKNLLQEIAVQSKVMNADDKKSIEDEIHRIEEIKSTYPVTLLDTRREL